MNFIFFDDGKRCPKCGSQMKIDYLKGEWFCPSCGYVEYKRFGRHQNL